MAFDSAAAAADVGGIQTIVDTAKAVHSAAVKGGFDAQGFLTNGSLAVLFGQWAGALVRGPFEQRFLRDILEEAIDAAAAPWLDKLGIVMPKADARDEEWKRETWRALSDRLFDKLSSPTLRAVREASLGFFAVDLSATPIGGGATQQSFYVWLIWKMRCSDVHRGVVMQPEDKRLTFEELYLNAVDAGGGTELQFIPPKAAAPALTWRLPQRATWWTVVGEDATTNVHISLGEQTVSVSSTLARLVTVADIFKTALVGINKAYA